MSRGECASHQNISFPTTEHLSVVNFFAGIGGLSYAFEKACADLSLTPKFIQHIDISADCQRVWAINNEDEAEKYVSKDIPAYKDIPAADVWLMSPPCQPFTKGGAEKHEKDNRSKPFLALVERLKAVNSIDLGSRGLRRPALLFIENVPAFGGSESYKEYKVALGEGWVFWEYTITPEHIGIPYARRRFYSLAIREGLLDKSFTESRPKLQRSSETPITCVADYLSASPEEIGGLVVSEKDLLKMSNYRFDILTRYSEVFGTITGGYGERLGSTGPLVAVDMFEVESERFRCIEKGERLRRLSPKEILKLHGFPSDFRFPEKFRERQVYRMLGNSGLGNALIVKRIYGALSRRANSCMPAGNCCSARASERRSKKILNEVYGLDGQPISFTQIGAPQMMDGGLMNAHGKSDQVAYSDNQIFSQLGQTVFGGHEAKNESVGLNQLLKKFSH